MWLRCSGVEGLGSSRGKDKESDARRINSTRLRQLRHQHMGGDCGLCAAPYGCARRGGGGGLVDCVGVVVCGQSFDRQRQQRLYIEGACIGYIRSADFLGPCGDLRLYYLR
jgi:hypothetical protein